MKFLIVGWYYLIYPIISAKEMFEIMGHEVIFFPLLHYQQKISGSCTLLNIFLKFLKDFDIEVILWWNWECDKNILKDLKVKTPHIIHCLFNWDHPFCLTEWELKHNRKILDKNIWDIAFVTSNDQFQPYLNSGTKEVYYLPMFADPEIHYPIHDKNYECDISFVMNHLYDDETRFPFPYVSRIKLIQDIIDAKINLHIYGPEHLKEIFPEQYKGSIHFTKNNRVFSNSKINLCTHVTKGYQYCNERVSTILHSGGLLMMDKVDGIDQILTHEHDCIFIDKENYIEQIKNILKNYDKYKHIKENAVITAKKYFSLEKWATTIQNKILNFKKPQSLSKISNFTHFIPGKVSIIMTYFNRIVQVENTLQTIEESRYPKNLIEVICYDDRSEIEPLITDITRFSFSIKIIYGKLDRDETIINPTFSYNQAFLRGNGEYIILQNSECMHIGDIISKAVLSLQNKKNSLVSFPCYATASESRSKEIFRKRNDSTSLKHILETTWKELDFPKEFKSWYNHRTLRPQALHFCNAFHRNMLDRVGVFDTKFIYLLCIDDNDYADRFMFHYNAIIEIPEHENYSNFAVHQYHGKYNKPRPQHVFQTTYSIARKIINSKINRNITKNTVRSDTVDSTSKIVHVPIGTISSYSKFFERLHGEWSMALVYIILDIEGKQKEETKKFLRKCVKECNVMILKKNDIVVEYSS